TIRIDRVGRRSEYIPRAALTMGLAIQPFVISGLAERPSFRGRGLLARVAYSLPETFVGRRLANPSPMMDSTRSTYRNRLTVLLKLPPGNITDQDGNYLARSLEVSDEA